MILACVASLLASSSPIAVFGAIPETAISSFDAVLCGRRFAHVCVEVFKGQPAFAHRNPHGSIPIVTNVIRVATSLNHPPPSPIDWQVRQTVRSGSAAKPLGFVAATTDDVTFPKISATMNGLSTTFAKTSPVCPQLWAHIGKRNDLQFAECLSGNVFDARRGDDRISVSHDFVPQKQVMVRSAMQRQLYGCSHFSTLSLEDKANGS